jgi:hypothetical protein
MRTISLFLFMLFPFFLISCDPGRNKNSNNENPSLTVDEIRKQKPTFPDLTPTEYIIGFNDPTFIRVVTNSAQLQEVWMVYYDLDAKKWEQVSLGKGSGENNIIGDYKFEKRYGFGKSYEDAPEFYMRYSDDGGQTWRGHKIEKALLNCDARGKDPKINWAAHLLVSSLLNPKNNLPDVAIVLQWNKPRSWNGPASALDMDFKKLCGVLREIPLVVR